MFQFSVDTFTKDFLVAVSGDHPTLQIVDAAGKSPEIQKIVDTRQSLVRLKLCRVGILSSNRKGWRDILVHREENKSTLNKTVLVFHNNKDDSMIRYYLPTLFPLWFYNTIRLIFFASNLTKYCQSGKFYEHVYVKFISIFINNSYI